MNVRNVGWISYTEYIYYQDNVLEKRSSCVNVGVDVYFIIGSSF